MAIRAIEFPIDDGIKIENVILSVFDKTDLDLLVKSMVEINPEIKLFSTGGTYNRIKDISPDNAIEISSYTSFPEMEGGLVKTLHPKIHAGIIGERHNPEHQEYIRNVLRNGLYIDMVVCNLYPFEKIISEQDSTFEDARGNIDIGGPAMIRAAAKNFMSCAPVIKPDDYQGIIEEMDKNGGSLCFDTRLLLAKKVFDMTSRYDGQISDYLGKAEAETAKKCYSFEGEEE